MFSRRVHPFSRMFCVVVIVATTFLCHSAVLLLAIWVAVLLPASIQLGIAKKHLLFCVAVLGPITIGLLVTWGILVGAPPGAPPHSAPLSGISFAGIIAWRLLVIPATFQIMFLALPARELIETLYTVGIRGEFFLVVLGAMAILPDLKRKMLQISDACRAAGLMKGLSLIDRSIQVPFILRGLVAWSLRGAIRRAENWQQRRLLDNIAMKWMGARSISREMILMGFPLIWLGYETSRIIAGKIL
jgi:energy-coupling factor transporter transmembrane protein EcfT